MLLPENFTPPTFIKTTYQARKLTAKDVYLDYMAVMSSINIIHELRGGSWPTKGLTIEDDLIDLAWHQREFENKSSFAFTVMNKDETECLGCIYFYSIGFRSQPENADKYDVDVSWWVTQKMFAEGFYDVLSLDIKNWIEQEWPFKKVYYSNKVLPSNFKI